MPRARFKKLPPERQAEILEAAGTAFSEAGYDGASLNKLLARLGISKGAFYYYFDDKADLFNAVLDLLQAELTKDAWIDLGSLNNENYWELLEGYLDLTLKAIESRPWSIGLTKVFLSPTTDARVKDLYREREAEIREFTESYINRGQDLGLVRKDLPQDLLLSMVMAMGVAHDHWLLENWEELDIQEAREIMKLIIDIWKRAFTP